MNDKKPLDFFIEELDETLSPEDYEEEKDEESATNDEEVDETSTDPEEEDAEKSEEEVVKSEEDKKAELEKERNARYAEQRRKREAEERERKIRDEAKIEVLKTNPYTGEEIKDEEDLRIYEVMKSLDDEGLDPVKDLPKKIAEQNRENAKKVQEEKAKEIAKNEKLDKEAKELKEAYPNLDLTKLANDSEFMKLCEEKGERWTMLEIYEYLDSKKQITNKNAADNKEKEEIDKLSTKIVKTPSSKSNGKDPNKTYLDMSDEEYIKLQKQNNKNDFF
jgi:hypothetical protein